MAAVKLERIASKISMVDVRDLQPYAKNARTHSPAQVEEIAESIKTFGFNNPILIDIENGVIAGHGRLEAALYLGMTEVPAIKLSHLTEAEKRAYIIADNKLALNAGWDNDLLSAELEAIALSGIDLSLLGFSDEELAEILSPGEDNDESGEEEKIPAAPEKAVTKKGDLWKLGNHRLLCGDSTSFTEVEKLMKGGKADLILTDPPYNVDYQGKTSKSLKIANDSMKSDAFQEFLTAAFLNMYRSAKDGAGIYVFHSDTESLNFRTSFKKAGFKLMQCCVWVKQHLVLGKHDYHWQHEPVLYGYKATGAHQWYSDRKQTTVWKFNKPERNEEHPTMKPVELMLYPVLNSTQKGDLVLDLFGGSGSSLIACERGRRTCYTMELSPAYCDVIVERYQKFTGESAVLESAGITYREIKAGLELENE